MTNQEILERAIQKAIDGGWRNAIMEFALDHNYTSSEWRAYIRSGDYRKWIFSHDFAKALWGEGKRIFREVEFKPDLYTNGLLPAWSIHLQQMVISDDPITYLGEHLND
jgi:hypothetical protein